MFGKLIIFSAPSGSGKTTIVKYLLNSELPLEFSISATTRRPRNGEVNGKDFYFISLEEFKHKIAENEFLEWEEVYTGNFYGTLKTEIDRIWNNGKHVIFEIDVKGGMNLKKWFPNNSLSVFVMPPSVEELERRLWIRSTEDADSIRKRIEKAVYELTFADQFDTVLVNENLQVAKDKAFKLVADFILN